jgi:hypothetical protein
MSSQEAREGRVKDTSDFEPLANIRKTWVIFSP